MKPDWFRRERSLAALVATLVVGLPQLALAAEGSTDAKYSRDPVDKIACEANLNLIFEAIQEYRKQHQNQLPDKLSDLSSDYIHDRNILTCPFVQKRGGLRWWREIRELSSDPLTSYGYEFTPKQFRDDFWRGLPKRSWREYKQRQMERLGEADGPSVPIVRCFAHRPMLNLAFGGGIYESELYWEMKFAHLVPEAELEPAKLFADRATIKELQAENFPPRDPRAEPRLLDLSAHYNGLLTDSWQGFPSNHLAGLPAGLQKFGGVPFDVRGVIQLRGKEFPVEFPERVEGIKVNHKFNRIHFLHGTAFGLRPETNIASYIVHYADGQTREIPVLYGKDVADWWFDARHPLDPTDAKVAWRGLNEAAKAYGKSLRLYQTRWENPRKDEAVASVSFVSTVTLSAPFLIAITVEP